MNTPSKDLTKEVPASPAGRVGGYVILARLADKARAEFLGGNVGEYHTGCPLDMFASAVGKLGLDPATTSTFQWLEADDKASH